MPAVLSVGTGSTCPPACRPFYLFEPIGPGGGSWFTLKALLINKRHVDGRSSASPPLGVVDGKGNVRLPGEREQGNRGTGAGGRREGGEGGETKGFIARESNSEI